MILLLDWVVMLTIEDIAGRLRKVEFLDSQRLWINLFCRIAKDQRNERDSIVPSRSVPDRVLFPNFKRGQHLVVVDIALGSASSEEKTRPNHYDKVRICDVDLSYHREPHEGRSALLRGSCFLIRIP